MVPRCWGAELACSLPQIKEGSLGTCLWYVAHHLVAPLCRGLFGAAHGCWSMGETRLEVELGGSLPAPMQLVSKGPLW